MHDFSARGMHTERRATQEQLTVASIVSDVTRAYIGSLHRTTAVTLGATHVLAVARSACVYRHYTTPFCHEIYHIEGTPSHDQFTLLHTYTLTMTEREIASAQNLQIG